MKKLTFLNIDKLTPIWAKEENKRWENLLQKKHRLYLSDEEFIILTGYNKEQLQILFTFQKKDGSLFYPIEIVCMHTDYQTLKKETIAALIVDYIDSYFQEFFEENRSIYLPLDFSTHEHEDIKFFMRGFIRHKHLEKWADELLANHGHGEHDIAPISSET